MPFDQISWNIRQILGVRGVDFERHFGASFDIKKAREAIPEARF